MEIFTSSSNYHTEVNPSDAGIHDRIVVMELIKATAQTHHIDIGQKEFKGKSDKKILYLFYVSSIICIWKINFYL